MATEPRFFKLILPPFQQLSIPKAFLKHLMDEMSEEGVGEATLRNRQCAQKSWHVKVKGFCFTKGWSDFVRDNDLGFGDFLVFTYKGSMIFDVKVFDRSCCEKKYHHPPATPTKRETQKRQERDDNQLEEEEIKIINPPNRRFKTRWNRSKVAQDSFEILLTENRMKRSRLSIPKKFAVAHGLIGKIFQSFLRDERGILWPVRLVQDSDRVRFGCGWFEFLSGNGLKGGDSCVFKLVNSGKICRGVKNAIVLDVIVSTSTSSSSSYDEDDDDENDDDGDDEDDDDDDDDDDGDDDDDDEWAPLLNLKNNDRIKIRPHHSFFEISLRPFNLKESRLVVPRHFANWNGLMGKSFTTTLRDGQGRSWKVELKHNIFNRPLYLCGDWAKILALNGLKVGDICKFELIRREKLQVMEFRMV